MMGLCTQMGVGTWIAMIIGWIAVLAVVVWAVCRMFPTTKRVDTETTPDTRRASGEMAASAYQYQYQQGHAGEGSSPRSSGADN